MPVIAVTIVDQTVGVTQVGEIGLTGPIGPTGTVSAAGDGTAGAPGIAFASDTDTGVWRPAANTLAFSTGGVERARINPGGELGIGTTSTGPKVHVYDASTAARVRVDSPASLEPGFSFASAGTETGVIYRPANTSHLRFYVNGADRASFNSDGNVGIGTTAPGTPLDVVKDGTNTGLGYSNISKLVDSSGNKGLTIGYDNSAQTTVLTANTTAVSSNMAFWTYEAGGSGWAERMRIAATGNVGIGTSSPASKLNVSGTKTTALATNADFLTLGLTVDDETAFAAGVGGGIAFRGKLSSSLLVYGAIDAIREVGTASDYRGALRFFTNNNSTGVPTERMRLDSSGHVTPGADNTQNIGSGSLRWATIYAGTGTINTSDERYKVLREGGDLSDAEYRAWSNVRAIVYQDKDSFERKGSAARLHVGYSWQSIQAAFEAEGLDAARYGLWCEDALEAPVEKTRMVSRPVEGQTETIPVLDEDGQPVFEQVQETEEVEQPFEEVRMIDGAPVLVKGVRTVAQPVFDSVQIRDEDGELLFDTPQPVEDPETGELVEGDPIPRMAPVPRMIRKAKTETVPVMEEVEETFTEMEPTGETRGALRYNQCSVIEAAWLRRELASVVARLSALEAA